ncbi:MAG: aminotransferase class V-fold PLP-dependent enzyme, partial [Flavobacteriales bacterium]|nr:aminotransferase class V-fold PLP-dependent enzyme [Flavobacteriales bacterium]
MTHTSANDTIAERLQQLECIALQLETPATDRKTVTDAVIHYAENFLDSLEDKKAYVISEEKGAGITSLPVSESGHDIRTLLHLLETQVDEPGLNPASGGHLGYVPGGGVYYSALGDFLADVTNRYAGIFFASPGAVRMENMMIEWLAGFLGYPETCGGNLASGGSIASLIAIVTARDAMEVKARDIERSVIYLSPQVHHCLYKAIRIAGLHECIVRHLPLDERFRIRPNKLAEQIAKDKADGLKPWLVIASAGTTDTGAIDPLTEIAGIAKKENLWFHIDAAYGGFFALCDQGRELLKGMDLSDSIVVDPHKGMFLPYGLGAVLVKDRKKLMASHYYIANYMQDAHRGADIDSPADLSPELTKHFRGLRMWLPLQLLGVQPFRAAVEEKMLLARYFHNEISQWENMEVGPTPDLSVVVFRYVPTSGDADAFNQAVMDRVLQIGRF